MSICCSTQFSEDKSTLYMSPVTSGIKTTARVYRASEGMRLIKKSAKYSCYYRGGTIKLNWYLSFGSRPPLT